MKRLALLVALAVVPSLAACAHAQSPASGSRPGAAAPEPQLTRANRTPTAYFGFGWTVENEDPPVVTQVVERSPAAAAGLRVGDIVLAVDGHPTTEPTPVFRNGGTPGRGYVLRVKRGAETLDLTIVAAPVPARR